MRQNQKNRFSGRYPSGTRSNKQIILRNTALDSTGPAGKLRGTALQLVDKYQAAAKDALLQNDRVLAETFLQYADHYIRIQNMAVANEQALHPVPHIPEEEENDSQVPEEESTNNITQEVALGAEPVIQKPVRQVRRIKRPVEATNPESTENIAETAETV